MLVCTLNNYSSQESLWQSPCVCVARGSCCSVSVNKISVLLSWLKWRQWYSGCLSSPECGQRSPMFHVSAFQKDKPLNESCGGTGGGQGAGSLLSVAHLWLWCKTESRHNIMGGISSGQSHQGESFVWDRSCLQNQAECHSPHRETTMKLCAKQTFFLLASVVCLYVAADQHGK